MSQIINLTPHDVREIVSGLTFKRSGTVARVSITYVSTGRINNSPCFRPVYGELEGLPDSQAETFFIVSSIVQAAVPERQDLLSPGELVRDENGLPVGCRGFKRG